MMNPPELRQMSAHITHLREVFPVPGQPNPEVVAYAEQLLEMAKSGEIVALAAATVHKDGSTGGGYVHSDNWGTLIGSLTVLTKRVVDQ